MHDPKLADLAATRAVILAAEGEHFSAGLDWSELSSRDIPPRIEGAAKVVAPK